MSSRVRMLGIVLALVGFAVGGSFLEGGPLRELAELLQSPAVNEGVLTHGRLGTILRDTGIVRPASNDFERFPARANEEGPAPFPEKREVGDHVWVARGGKAWFERASAAEEEAIESGAPVLSLRIDPHRLLSPEIGIQANPLQRGRAWEQPAQLRFSDDGVRQFESQVGLRIHGGWRRTSGRNPSFRAYFRQSRGAPQLAPEVLAGQAGGAVRTLVIRGDSDLVAVLAHEMVRMAGSLGSRVRATQLFLNGDGLGTYALLEHPSSRQWREHLGHDDFLAYRVKGHSDRPAYYAMAELVAWAGDRSFTMTPAMVEARVDLEKLMRHLIVILYAGTNDWRQGLAIRNERDPSPRWFWVHWDLDGSFLDLSRSIHGGPARPSWEQEAMQLLLTDLHWSRWPAVPMANAMPDARALIVQRLWAESPEFRERFVKMLDEVLAGPFAEERLIALVDGYRAAAPALSVDGRHARRLDEFREFFENRGDFLRQDVERAAAEAERTASR